MKLHNGIMFLALMAIVIFFPTQQAQAQVSDTLIVEWESTPGSGIPVVNILRSTIANDTLRPASRVYRLRRGGFYWITDRIQNADFPLCIVGETESAVLTGETDYGPAVIQRVAREGGTAPDGTMFESTGDLILKNLWLMGQTDQGVLGNYEPIKLLGDGKRYVFDNVIFDRNDWHHLGPDGPNNKFYIINCKFRNIFGPTQIWEGLGIRIEVGADTVVIENNTFLNIGFTPFQSEAAPVNYIRFNHNTLVNIGRAESAGSIWKEAYFTNNVYVNPYWHGDSESMYTDPGRQDPYNGFFGIAALPARFGTNFDRQIVLANNSYWRDPRFDAFDATFVPPIQPQPFVNDSTTAWFTRWPDNMKMVNNYLNVNPDLVTYPVDAAMFDSMTNHISDLYSDPQRIPATRYFYDPGRDETSFVNSIWPIPENFAYTNAQLLTGGTDGLPVGDLNWFPESKVTFLANKAQYVKDIEDMVQAPVLEIVTTVEAEAATLGGDASVFVVQGFTYFQMDGSGSILWTYDLPTAGQYDLNIWINMRGNTQKGNRIIVNGTEIHDSVHGWGEYIFDATSVPNFSASDWIWHTITQAGINEAGALTLPAGQNTIKITPSWGWMSFAGFDLLQAGTTTVVKSLRATDAVFEGVTPFAEGVVWTPSYFKAVTLNAGGSISFPVDAPYDASYMMRIFFATGAAAQAKVDVDGAEVVPSVAFADTADVFTSQFLMTQGTHTITVSSAAGGVTLDFLQVIAFVPVGINGPENLPLGYYLQQNYPNPFNPTTSINFALGKASNVKLSVYNVLGQRVAILVDSRLSAGAHTVLFDASHLSSGIYFYRIEAGDFKLNKRMLFLK